MNQTPLHSIIGKTVLTVVSITLSVQLSAQAVTENTGNRFYEHHSSDMTGMPFGSGADGSQSGYDFVQKRFYGSFDPQTGGAYMNGEEANLDMVEHNGVFGPGSSSAYLGFTSGVSSIWNGEIKGNGTTRWMKAPANFDYAAVNSVSQISAVYNPASASDAIAEVRNDEVYIGKIRETGLFVVMRCYNTHIPQGQQGATTNSYFDFDYKSGSLTTGIAESEVPAFSIYPNPSAGQIRIKMYNNRPVRSVKISSLLGEEILQLDLLSSESIDVNPLSEGLYILTVTTVDGDVSTKPFMKKAD